MTELVDLFATPRRAVTGRLLEAAESGQLPDRVIKAGIELRLRAKLRHENRGGPAAVAERKRDLLADRAAGPVTTHVEDANRQHYEVPSPFFRLILGPRLRYSCCYWPSDDELADGHDPVTDITGAELAALDQTATRAAISDGDRVLELGAGWGSLSLYLANRFPNSEIVTVSNSKTQKAYIDGEAERLGLTNLTVHTADIGEFAPPGVDDPTGRFDRVVSVEMFEHVRNHRELLRRVSTWLRPGGTCFIHVFSHKTVAWHFDDGDDNDWLARYFFAGGTMPSDDLLLQEQRDLTVIDHWWLDGTHYAKTLQAWLDRLDGNRPFCLDALAAGDDPAPPELQLSRWRLFLLASIGTWGLSGGQEFGVSHYLFQKPQVGQA
jgi:cyclopropane-fatty-acyl-phospholipid synthase